MIRILLFTLIFFMGSHLGHTQQYLEFKDNDSTETNDERINFIIEFMSGLTFQTCADIGSGNLECILKIANAYSDTYFVLEDIDSSLCNRDQMMSQIEKFNLSEIDTSHITIQIGDTNHTHLATNQFDLVILSGLIHELNDIDEFFAELKRIVKPRGTLLISDAFYDRPPGLHHGCTNRFLTNQELEEIISEQNLIVLKEWRLTGIKTKRHGPHVNRVLQVSFQ